MKINAATLPDDTTQLKQLLVDFQEHYDKETDILLEQIRHLRAQLFGRKSEKLLSEDGAQPLQCQHAARGGLGAVAARDRVAGN